MTCQKRSRSPTASMIEEGRIALDIAVTLPHPPRRDSVDPTMWRNRLLAQLLKRERNTPKYVI